MIISNKVNDSRKGVQHCTINQEAVVPPLPVPRILLKISEEVIDTDRRLTLDKIIFQLFPNFKLSRTSFCKIISEDFGLLKVCARLIPCVFTVQHKKQRVNAAFEFQRYFDKGDSLFDQIVIGDEIWIHHRTSEL